MHDMELAELRQEAEKLGYKLVPIKKYVRFLPCLCGCNRRIHWSYIGDGEFSTILECKGCGIEAKGKTEEEAKHNWNRMMTNLKGEKNAQRISFRKQRSSY